MKDKLKKKILKEFEEKEFKKRFGVELDTPISGRIVAEEMAIVNNEHNQFLIQLEDYDKFVKRIKKFISKILSQAQEETKKEIMGEIEKYEKNAIKKRWNGRQIASEEIKEIIKKI